MKKKARLRLRRTVLAALVISLAGVARAGEEPEEERTPLPRAPSFTHRRFALASPLPSPYERNNQVWCDYYEPTGSGKAPAILVLHSLGVIAAHKEHDICRAAARAGIAALLMTLPYHMARSSPGAGEDKFLSGDVDQTVTAFRQANADALKAVEWLASQPRVDAQRLGIVGLSIGALLSVRVMANEPRLKFGVLIVGGGGLKELLEESIIGDRVKREIIRRKLDFLLAFVKLQEIDPLRYAAQVRDRRLLMIDGIYDMVIPPSAARKLWEALDHPSLLWIPTGHAGAVLHRGALIAEGLRFIKAAADPQTPAPARTVRFKNLMSPKLSIVGVTNGEVRPALTGEVFRFDRAGKVAFDLGVMPFRLLAGISANIAPLEKLGWTDLSAGIAVDYRGSGKPYFGFGFHF